MLNKWHQFSDAQLKAVLDRGKAGEYKDDILDEMRRRRIFPGYAATTRTIEECQSNGFEEY